MFRVLHLDAGASRASQTFLREEAVEIGEANDSNDGTAQRDHHLFLWIQPKADGYQTTAVTGIRTK